MSIFQSGNLKLAAAIRAFKKGKATRKHVEAAYEQYKIGYVQGYRDTPEGFDGFFVQDKVGDKLGLARDEFPPLDQMIEEFPDE